MSDLRDLVDMSDLSDNDRKNTTNVPPCLSSPGWAIIPRKRNWFYRLDILSADGRRGWTHGC